MVDLKKARPQGMRARLSQLFTTKSRGSLPSSLPQIDEFASSTTSGQHETTDIVTLERVPQTGRFCSCWKLLGFHVILTLSLRFRRISRR